MIIIYVNWDPKKHSNYLNIKEKLGIFMFGWWWSLIKFISMLSTKKWIWHLMVWILLIYILQLSVVYYYKYPFISLHDSFRRFISSIDPNWKLFTFHNSTLLCLINASNCISIHYWISLNDISVRLHHNT